MTSIIVEYEIANHSPEYGLWVEAFIEIQQGLFVKNGKQEKESQKESY